MKKKIYFIISALVQIAGSIYAIISADKLVAKMIKSMDIYPDIMKERVVRLFQNSGNTYIMIIALICILVNSLIIYYAYHDKLLKNKGRVIACSVVSIFTANYSIIQLFALINIIVMASLKREKAEDYPDKKQEMPTLDREEINTKNKITAIILLAVYFSQFIWADILPDNEIISKLIGIMFYIVMICLSIIFFKDLLKRNFSIYKKNFKAYLQNLLPQISKYYLIYFGVAILSFVLANASTSANQSKVEELPIWYLLPLAVIYAPIVEETLFRGCIRRFIKNDKVFIVVSGIVFGLLHTIFSEASIYKAIVLALPYGIMGSFLAYMYAKTNNILTNMSMHAFHNFVATMISILIVGM